MGRTPCCDKKGLKRGPWTPEEDDILTTYINKNGHGSWRSLPKLIGLLRCGNSCRLRWTNYLRPDIKRGGFTVEEEKLVIQLHGILGNRWAAIASQLQGRTDNDIKNLWNTHLKKRLLCLGLDPKTHKPLTPSTRHMAQWETARLQAEARLSRESSLFYNPASAPVPAPTSTTADHFLRIWNSDVGESFRSFYHPSAQTSPAAASASQASTVSAVTTTADHVSHNLVACSAATPSSNQNEEDDHMECKSYKSYTTTTHEDHHFIAHSSSVQSDDDDSSDSTLQLLLDFPINNDMSFLQ